MKLVLINPPWYFINAHEKIISQNLAIGYLASFLIYRDINVEVIDSLAEGFGNHKDVFCKGRKCVQVGLSYEDICKRIGSDVTHVGITVPFNHLAPISRELASMIKRHHKNLKIILGGVFPSTFAKQALTEDVDYVVRGEGELPLYDLMVGKSLSDIPGLIYRENGIIHDNGHSLPINNLDEMPFPARDVMPLEKYFLISQRMERDKRTLSIITSRGCPFDCNFCSVHPVFGYKWRARSPENVIEEIKKIIKDYKIEHIEFEDDNLTFDKKRAESIFDGLIQLNSDITWSAHNGVRIDTLDKDLIKKMKKSGCIQLNLAIESGNNKVLKAMNKKLSLEKVVEVVGCCDQAQIYTIGFLIVGYPGETKKSFKETLKFFKRLLKLGLNGVAPFILNPYPGTKLYDLCVEKDYLNRKVDIDHFFSVSDTDDILINTPEFDSNTVATWFNLANNINKPYLGYIKRFIKKYIPRVVRDKIKYYLKMFFK